MDKQRIIGLITDFGRKGSHYVASMKAVIMKINPKARIIDISHEIHPFSINEASYILKATIKYFPENSIFIIVVDPGVGSSREILALKTYANYFLIGPNNGLFGLSLKLNEVSLCVQLNKEEYYLDSTAKTFQGRDIMAPLAAHLSLGKNLRDLGDIFPIEKLISIEKYDKLPIYDANRIKCYIQYIDNFGNAITNIFVTNLENLIQIQQGEDLFLEFNNKKFKGKFTSHFGDVPVGSLLFLRGSTGYLEISINQGNAQKHIGFSVGDLITIIK